VLSIASRYMVFKLPGLVTVPESVNTFLSSHENISSEHKIRVYKTERFFIYFDSNSLINN